MGESRQAQAHPFAPVWDERSRVLMLGTFPSVRSRAEGFYYGHPQNRFWRVLAAVYRCEAPADIAQKRALLLKHGVALWDVLESCEIARSNDASIRRAVPSDVPALLAQAPIERVYCNGQKAGELYRRHLEGACDLKAVVLPSTSPANAAWSLDRLVSAWQVIV